jgi:alpha-galactosidase/6-phospho-beta-glucosidase family protein
MSLHDIRDEKSEINMESFVEILEELEKNYDEEKVKLAKKIFTETYYEGIQAGMNSRDALQKAVIVTNCFLIGAKT